MARAGLRAIVFGMATTGLLMGCVESGGKAGTGESAGIAAVPAKKKSGAQDVEAPEVFQANDSALWDGRPSLGGIWVASPDVTNPERVLMFNPATGKSVTGALFKRERDNPGPKLQLSSDAAEALGILAGQPTEIKVTALRKVEAEEPAPVATAAATAPADPAAAPAKDSDAASVAAAALAAVDADKTKTDPKAKNSDPAAATAAGASAVTATAVEGGGAAVDGTPKKKTWKERRAEAKAAREAKKKAAAEAKAAAAAGTAVAAEGEAPTTTPDAATAAVAPIESAPLDARNPDVAKAADKASKKASASKPKPAAEAPVAAAAPADPAAPVGAGGPSRPIQVASFSKEDNAKRAAEALAKIGVTATPQKSEKAGKAVWGVVVTGDDAMLKKIKDAGFADAYFLK